MSKTMEITIHEIATDGLPDMDNLTGRVAFIFDGCVVDGWPLDEKQDGVVLWEADSDVGRGGSFSGVTHWLEFPVPVWEIERNGRWQGGEVTMKQVNGISRRVQVEHRTKLEVKIDDLIGEIEMLGAHPKLTDVVVHLHDAFNALADWVDVGGPVLPKETAVEGGVE